MNQDIEWPFGAEPHGLLKKDHDRFWFNKLNDERSKDSIKSSYIPQSLKIFSSKLPLSQNQSTITFTSKSPQLSSSSYIPQSPATLAYKSSVIPQSSASSGKVKYIKYNKCDCGCFAFEFSKFSSKEYVKCHHVH